MTPIRSAWFQGVSGRAVSELLRGLHPVAEVATKVWKNRVTLGAQLLLKFGSDLTPADLMLYWRVVQGPVVGRTIAFDLTGTLLQQDKLHRGVLALLVGLWATNNQLILYTNDHRESVVGVCNGYPLFQLVFGLTGLERFPEVITAERVEQAEQVVDYQKRLGLVDAHWGWGDPFFAEVMSREFSGAHIMAFGGGKLPFPGFDYDVILDDDPKVRDGLALLGFSQRAVVATPTGTLPGATLYQQLVDLLAAIESEPLQSIFV